MLTEHRELAHTSSKPGKTQRINFFTVNDHWSLVDLPGYGYAKISKEKRVEFNKDISGYLTERENLEHVMLLIDSQIEPQGGDLAFANWLQECEVPFSIVFTKTDRGSENKLANCSSKFLSELDSYGIEPKETFACSAKTKTRSGATCIGSTNNSLKSPRRKRGGKDQPELDEIARWMVEQKYMQKVDTYADGALPNHTTFAQKRHSVIVRIVFVGAVRLGWPDFLSVWFSRMAERGA